MRQRSIISSARISLMTLSSSCRVVVDHCCCCCCCWWWWWWRRFAACQFGGDLVFTIDSSGSIGLVNFIQIQVTSFVSKLAHALDLDDALENRGDGLGGFRVGLLTFSTGVTIGFQLNTYSDKALLLKAIEVGYLDGTTNTADAIRSSCYLPAC